MGENHFAPLPSAMYGAVLLMAAMSYLLLQQRIVRAEGPSSALRQALGNDWKGKVSLLLYTAGIVASFRYQWLAQLIYVTVAIIWLVPDRRIEHTLKPGS
jgi:uncharacterized membrane protein